MTQSYLDHWLDGANHYRMQLLLGDAADNPDQRIAEDINMFVEKGLYLGLGLLNAMVTLYLRSSSFFGPCRRQAPLHLFGINWAIPGYLVWAALIYSIAGTAITHLIGRPLINLNFLQQRYEADFRFNLVRVRENSEQIALLNGRDAETRPAAGTIQPRRRQLDADHAADQAADVPDRRLCGRCRRCFPYIVVSPAYFAGAMQLGGLMQTASAFGSVQGALSFFQLHRLSPACRMARGDAATLRLRACRRGRPRRSADPAGHRGRRPTAGDAVEMRRSCGPPADRAPLASADNISIRRRARAGHRALGFRQIDAVPRHRRHLAVRHRPIGVPAGANIVMLPQRPYFPIAPLAAAVAYPAEPGTFDAERIAEIVTAVGTANPCRGSRRKRTGTACCRSASSSGSASRAPPACARLPVPRRGHRFARRAGRGRALPAAARAAAGDDHRFDRASLDAGGVPRQAD